MKAVLLSVFLLALNMAYGQHEEVFQRFLAKLDTLQVDSVLPFKQEAHRKNYRVLYQCSGGYHQNAFHRSRQYSMQTVVMGKDYMRVHIGAIGSEHAEVAPIEWVTEEDLNYETVRRDSVNVHVMISSFSKARPPGRTIMFEKRDRFSQDRSIPRPVISCYPMLDDRSIRLTCYQKGKYLVLDKIRILSVGGQTYDGFVETWILEKI